MWLIGGAGCGNSRVSHSHLTNSLTQSLGKSPTSVQRPNSVSLVFKVQTNFVWSLWLWNLNQSQIKKEKRRDVCYGRERGASGRLGQGWPPKHPRGRGDPLPPPESQCRRVGPTGHLARGGWEEIAEAVAPPWGPPPCVQLRLLPLPLGLLFQRPSSLLLPFSVIISLSLSLLCLFHYLLLCSFISIIPC